MATRNSSTIWVVCAGKLSSTMWISLAHFTSLASSVRNPTNSMLVWEHADLPQLPGSDNFKFARTDLCWDAIAEPDLNRAERS